MMRSRQQQSGFTLLEVLLAFVIFALSFATVLEIVGGSVRSTVRARDYSEAALTAQSIMELVGTEIPLAPGGYQGETDDGFRWTVDVFDFEPMDDDPRIMEVAQGEGTLLFWVDLHLEWGDGLRSRHAQFTTLRAVMEAAIQ
ncbi:type II secretion system protein [Marinihelvus fidelis]|uniref:Type II secretion system protein n=1 Tax=Marinihelvus fidelis TaxID=2613842 RepID=A0A5N0T7A1_9GAMM|nr:type II secretion system protein [Marinihelvus fidelis]KAA9130772.1 type II secretion system protein [Marinihelvus fidelis]